MNVAARATPWLDRAALLLVRALLALALLWALSSLWLPFGWDQGLFGYVADVIHRGGMPYRDVWEIKGPLVLYLYAAAQGLFGSNMWSVRVLDLLALAGSSVAGYRLLRDLEGKGCALFGVAIMVLAFASFGNWYTAQPDGWAAHALVVVVALLAAPRLTEARVVSASGIIGLLTLMKPTYSLYGALVLIALLSTAEMRGRVRAWALPALAFALPIAAAVAYFAARGALSQLVDQHITFNQERLASDPSLQIGKLRVLGLTLSILTSYPDIALAVAPAALGIAVAAQKRARVGLMLLVWPFLALLTIALQRKFLFHNYSSHPVYPPILLAAALGLGWLWREAGERLWQTRVLALLSGLLIAYQVVKVPAGQLVNWLRFASGRQTLEQYRAWFEGPLPWLQGLTPAQAFGFSVTRDIRFAENVRQRTRPSDEVFVWADPLVNHLSDRPSLTPITAPEGFTLWGSPERRQRYRDELVAGVLARRAAIIGIPRVALLPADSPEYSLPTGFPGLIAALDRTYRRTGSFDDLEIYEPR